MRPSRLLATTLAVPVLLCAGGCGPAHTRTTATGPHAGATAVASTSPATTSPASPASAPGAAPSADAGSAAGASADARLLAPLPSGAATGSAVLAYSGVGEVSAPFHGQCSHEAGSTRVTGTADTAHITVDVTPSGGQVRLDDVGLSATSDLTSGRYAVSGRHLSLAAHLAHDGQSIGTITLEVACGG